MKHLTCGSRVTFRNGSIPRNLTFRVHAVLPSDRWKAGTSAANQSGLLGNGEAGVERPIGKLSRRRAIISQNLRALVFERIGHDRLEDSASGHQRNPIIACGQRNAAAGIDLLKYGPKVD